MEDEVPEQTLGERLASQRAEQGARARKASTLPRFSHTAGPAAASKRGSKSRPREVSSRRAVPLGRDRCLGLDAESSGKRKAFDPRFEEHCGDLLDGHVDRNFAFVDGMREKEASELEREVRKKPLDEGLRAHLRRVQAQQARRKAEMRKKEIVTEARKKEKEAVKQGKTPYFMKKSDMKELELKAKFKELKQKGGLKKYIEKRRKRLTSKDRKHLPARRDSGTSRP